MCLIKRSKGGTMTKNDQDLCLTELGIMDIVLDDAAVEGTALMCGCCPKIVGKCPMADDMIDRINRLVPVPAEFNLFTATTAFSRAAIKLTVRLGKQGCPAVEIFGKMLVDENLDIENKRIVASVLEKAGRNYNDGRYGMSSHPVTVGGVKAITIIFAGVPEEFCYVNGELFTSQSVRDGVDPDDWVPAEIDCLEKGLGLILDGTWEKVTDDIAVAEIAPLLKRTP